MFGASAHLTDEVAMVRGADGPLAIAGIHLTGVPELNYERHLFRERQVRSVIANTRADGRARLDLDAADRLRGVRTRPGGGAAVLRPA